MKIRLDCTCGEQFDYDLNTEKIEEEFRTEGLLPILVPHKDHFITVYFDEQLNVKSITRILLIHDEESSLIVKSNSSGDTSEIINRFLNQIDPNKFFIKYLSVVLQEITKPEDLFIGGRITGNFIWKKKREPIIQMGAAFSVNPFLIIKTEMIPIFEKTVKLKVLHDERQSLVLNDTISPHFIIGMAQGILDAIQEYIKSKVSIVIEYVMSGTTVFLTVKQSD